MHCGRNFPFRKQTSDLDIAVEEGCEDEDYLRVLADTVPRLFDGVSPELVLFQAGVDPLKEDKLGRLKMTRKGLQERNHLVVEILGEIDPVHDGADAWLQGFELQFDAADGDGTVEHRPEMALNELAVFREQLVEHF